MRHRQAMCREEIDAVDVDEVNEILAETDEEDWAWEDYDVMDRGEVTINSVTPGELEDEDETLDPEDDGEDDSDPTDGGDT